MRPGQALDRSSIAAGLAGRKWLLEHQNYDTLARDYLQKIEACVKVHA